MKQTRRTGRNNERCEATSVLSGQIAHPLKCDFLFICTRKNLYRNFRLRKSKQRDYISDRIKGNVKQTKINEHETPLDEILYDQFSVDKNLDKQSRTSTRKSRINSLCTFQLFCSRSRFAAYLQPRIFLEEKNLLGWIELIENQKLYKAVKSLSVEDQTFISYIVKECKTQSEISYFYNLSQSQVCCKFNKILRILKNNICNRQKHFCRQFFQIKKHFKRLVIYIEE